MVTIEQPHDLALSDVAGFQQCDLAAELCVDLKPVDSKNLLIVMYF